MKIIKEKTELEIFEEMMKAMGFERKEEEKKKKKNENRTK